MDKGPAQDTEIERLIKGVRRQIAALEKHGGTEDPWIAAELLKMSGELRDAGYRAVGRLHRRGVRWNDIGYSQGLDGVTAGKRYRRWLKQPRGWT